MGKTASRFAILWVATLPACALAGRGATPSEEAARQRSFAAGVSALDLGDFSLAAGHLAPVAAICPVDETGRRAMLLLAAGELDPRNPDGRPDAAAELTAFQIARPGQAEPWAAVLAAELYALSLDYGADAIPPNDPPDVGVIWSRYLDDGDFAARRAAPAREPVGAEADDTARADVAVAAVVAPPAVESPRNGGPLCDVPSPIRGLTLPELTGPPAGAGRRGEPGTPGAGEDARALMAEVDRLRAQLAEKEQELDRIRRTLRP
ncbi:MAG TPA: hypothetical protein VMN78_00805 [Longimicrobiales bacterium]|nr:hypothetical protein [Longimicrobiales bacterium]